jgi:hypothetical protein
MDELFEAFTLIQTGKIRDFPVVLFGSDYWKGLLEWLRNTVEAEGKISPEDMELLKVTDSPQEAVDHIVTRFTEDLKARAEANGIAELGSQLLGK